MEITIIEGTVAGGLARMPGDKLDLPDSEALELIAMGRAKLTPEAPAPSTSNKKPKKPTKPVAVAGNKGMMKHDLGV